MGRLAACWQIPRCAFAAPTSTSMRPTPDMHNTTSSVYPSTTFAHTSLSHHVREERDHTKRHSPTVLSCPTNTARPHLTSPYVIHHLNHVRVQRSPTTHHTTASSHHTHQPEITISCYIMASHTIPIPHHVQSDHNSHHPTPRSPHVPPPPP
jgi:hypothetical protein